MTVKYLTTDEINRDKNLMAAWWDAWISHKARDKEAFLRRLDLLAYAMPPSMREDDVARRLLASIRKDAERLIA
jgi:hypothetical protein